jgi:hypothetical protein
MLSRLARRAHELDEWLHQNVGRAYVAILGWGLVLSILASIAKLGHALSSFGLITLVLQGALLVNQLAQWHELRERRRRHKQPRPATQPGNLAGAHLRHAADPEIADSVTNPPT